jgi:hypothetical protein
VKAYVIDKAVPEARVRRRARQLAVSPPVRSQDRAVPAERPLPNVDQVLDDSFPASDPPSWTGAISRVGGSLERDQSNERIVRRIRAEFLEMPGLCLTIEQAQRLWALEPDRCQVLLTALIDSRFLRRTERGLFVLRTPSG